MDKRAHKTVERPLFTSRPNLAHQHQVNFIIAESMFWEKKYTSFKKLLLKPVAIVKKFKSIGKLVKKAMKPN